MAIGDAVAQMMGTATTTRQPSSGVEEQIACIAKQQTADAMNIYDGSNAFPLMEAGVNTAVPAVHTSSNYWSYFNIAVMITNSIYLQKGGTTERIYVGGVQTNS